MSLRVLIADRDKSLLELYRAYMSWHGFTVVTAASGLDCLSKLRACAPDLLVLEPDLLWGGGNGVVAAMREDPDLADIPVIVLSNQDDYPALFGAEDAPVRERLIKPQSPPALVRVIHQLTGKSAACATADSSLWIG